MSLEDYARVKLVGPLGITDVEWVGELAGMPAAGFPSTPITTPIAYPYKA